MDTHRCRATPGASCCWHCTAWGGFAYGGPHSYCKRPDSSRVQASPAVGCCSFVREVGADDEPGPPACDPLPPSRVQVYRPPVVPLRWAP